MVQNFFLTAAYYRESILMFNLPSPPSNDDKYEIGLLSRH